MVVENTNVGQRCRAFGVDPGEFMEKKRELVPEQVVFLEAAFSGRSDLEFADDGEIFQQTKPGFVGRLA